MLNPNLDSKPYQISSNASVLSSIYQSDITMCCFCQPASWALSHASKHAAKSLKERVLQLKSDDLATLKQAVHQYFYGLTHYDLITRHIEQMLEMFDTLFEVGEIGLTIEPQQFGKNPSFHTYQGIVKCISHIGGGGIRWKDPLSSQNPQQLCDGDISLFKGEGWIEQDSLPLEIASPDDFSSDSRLFISIEYIA